MDYLPISIVIPVSKDVKIRECIRNIDEGVEIVVVLNNCPSREVIDIVKADNRCKVIYVEGTGCNLAYVFNRGIISALNEKVLLTNSDCIFTPGLVSKVFVQLEQYEVVKARVAFSFSNRRQRLVAECRRLFHQVFDDGTKLFGPGLSFRKSICSKIGGYFFDETMGWGEDGDLSDRIYSAGIRLMIVKDYVLHGEEHVIHDLRVARSIGRGCRARDRITKRSLVEAFKSDWDYVINDPKRRFSTAYLEGGFPLFVYFIIWKMAFYWGYYSQG